MFISTLAGPLYPFFDNHTRKATLDEHRAEFQVTEEPFRPRKEITSGFGCLCYFDLPVNDHFVCNPLGPVRAICYKSVLQLITLIITIQKT